MSLDRRRAAFRADIADIRLQGRISAPRFVEGAPAMVRTGAAALRAGPRPDAPLDATWLRGEAVRVFDRADGFAWAQSEVDGYVGYVAESDLGAPQTATHRVTALATHVFPTPDVKAPVIGWLPMGARIPCPESPVTGFTPLAEGGWVPLQAITLLERTRVGDHAAETQVAETQAAETQAAETDDEPDDGRPDWVAIAERFLGAPYLWGGKTVWGIDCSGLIQIARQMAGLAAPRDSDMQAAELGAPIPWDGPLKRGDLVFWRGHVGVMRDGATLLHANAGTMSCVSEPLETAATRIRHSGGGAPTGARRITEF